MRGITLYRFHKIGDQVQAALQLVFNLTPVVVDLFIKVDQAIVNCRPGAEPGSVVK